MSQKSQSFTAVRLKGALTEDTLEAIKAIAMRVPCVALSTEDDTLTIYARALGDGPFAV